MLSVADHRHRRDVANMEGEVVDLGVVLGVSRAVVCLETAGLACIVGTREGLLSRRSHAVSKGSKG